MGGVITGSGGVAASGGAGGGAGGAPPTGCSPNDVIFVLDNSGSMYDESVSLQNQLAPLWQTLSDRGADSRFVVVSSLPTVSPVLGGAPFPPYGICVPAPFGSGNCANDSNPPNYLHIIREVNSHNALEQVMNTYPEWQSALRVSSLKTFVVITDDEANPSPSATDFASFADPAFGASRWVFSGFFCGAMSQNCVTVGTTYQALVDRTGGVHADLATGAGDAGFGAIVDRILTRSGCD